MSLEFPHLTIDERLGCLARPAAPSEAPADGNVVQSSSGESFATDLMATNPTGCFTKGKDYIIQRDGGRAAVYFKGAARILYDNRDICGTRLTTEMLDKLDDYCYTVTMVVNLNNLKGAKHLLPSNIGIDVAVWKSGEGSEITGSRLEYVGHGLLIHGATPDCLLAVWNKHVCELGHR